MSRARKRLVCDGACKGETVHLLGGVNGVGRPIWFCSHCEEHRVGVFNGVDVLEPATDGGVDQLRAQLPETCPKCVYDPSGDDLEFRSGGGWSHDSSVMDGIWIERFLCPRCGETVARTEQRMFGGRP